MAHLQIQQRANGQVAVLDLDGRLTLGEDSVTLRDSVRGLLADGHKNIVINMKDVDYVDSSGLGELVSAFATAKRDDAKLKLINLAQRVHGLLQITKLLTVFETYDSEEEAIRSFEATATTSTSV
jgi:anti-sigma B factor antagonist